MEKVKLFADYFKTQCNCRVWINPNFKLDFLPKVLTNLFKTTSTGIGKKKGLYKSTGFGRKMTIETRNCEENMPVQEFGLGRKRSIESRALEEKNPTCPQL